MSKKSRFVFRSLSESTLTKILTTATTLVRISFLVIFTIWVFSLFRAGEQVIGALGVVVGVAALFGPLFTTTATTASANSLWQAVYRFATTSILFAVVLISLTVVNPQLAQERLSQGVRATDMPSARQNLDTASALGANIHEGVQAEIEQLIGAAYGVNRDQQISQLAELYYIYGGQDSQWHQSLESRLMRFIEEHNLSQAALVARVLAMIAPEASITLTGELNDEFVMAQSEGDFNRARNLVQAISLLDVGLGDRRSRCARSITQMNLGFYYEESPELSDYLTSAEQAYTKAIQLDDSNFRAHYLLASMLLINSDDNTTQLQRAATIARNARQRYLEGQVLSQCAEERGDASDIATWHRFLLLSTEAGARLSLGDTYTNVAPLIDEAIAMAVNYDQFGSKRFTAEAYHYRALLLGDDVDQATLCMIVTRSPDPQNTSLLVGEANLANPRHVAWVDQAQAQLDSKGWICLPH